MKALNKPQARPVLDLDSRVEAPWLAISADCPARAAAVVLVGDARRPGMWIRIDDEVREVTGAVARAELVPLYRFGVICSLYPHARVLTLRRDAPSTATRYGLLWQWETEARVDRVRVSRSLWPLVVAAAEEINENAKLRAGFAKPVGE